MSGTSPAAKTALIPWDPASAEHFERMIEQRKTCGWRAEEVPTWKGKQLQGTKMLYWIVLPGDLPDRGSLLERHIARYPTEASPLRDTATREWGQARPSAPSGEAFSPIGHFALETSNDEVSAGRDDVVWVKNLYVSWAVQTGGLGKSAMAGAEDIASGPLVSADAIALDTVSKELQESDEWKTAVYTDAGLDIPEPYKTNQEWYERLGYHVVAEDPGPPPYMWVNPRDGVERALPRIVLVKDLTS